MLKKFGTAVKILIDKISNAPEPTPVVAKPEEEKK